MVGQIIGAGLGLATANWQDRRQIEQQKKLQNLQIAGSKEMGAYNQQLALEMWDKTNYAAQRKQMEKAGLNVGLMYGSGGAGGGTTSTPTGSVSAGTATGGSGEIGMGIQMGLQAQLTKAQTDLIKAQEEKTKAEKEKLTGPDTAKTGAETANIAQLTDNAKLQKQILQYDKEIREIEANVAGLTKEDQIELVKQALKKLKGEAISAETQGEIDQQTKEQVIKAAQLANDAVEAGIKATKAGTTKTEAETTLTKAKTDETRQNIKNLEATETGQVLLNGLRTVGIEPTDNKLFRIIGQTINSMGVTPEKIGRKMKAVITWLKGQNGAQTKERFEEIMRATD